MLDWLIIGGGIHGVHIAARLIGDAGVVPERLRILDPADHLLARWRACTKRTGMTHLRSPAVHNLDLHPRSLQRFAKQHRQRTRRLFAAPYDRPSLELFNTHCDAVVREFGLSELHIEGRAEAVSVDCHSVSVGIDSRQTLEAKNVVLAIGAGDQPSWPAWAPRANDRVHHIFEPDFCGWPSGEAETVGVIGGGISAGQVVLRLLDEGHRVEMVSRHPLREHQFDSDPGWLGPRFMNRFSGEGNLDERRALITRARHKGSVPPDVRRALRRAIDGARVGWHESEVAALQESADGLRISLNPGRELTVDRVLLATGFGSQRPGGAMLDELIASASLPCASCGYPVVDSELRWHPRIHVSGPLAELELGPAARNISGARRAAARLVPVARGDRPSAVTR